MKILRDKDNIILLKAETRYELCSTFWRLQEYYESPKFRNKFFELEEYMDWYAGEYGNFTYMDDWNGFNVPGNIVRKFFENMPHELFKKEEKLYSLLEKYIEGNEKFYVIGVHKEDSTVDHEYSHAFYYIFPEYKKKMLGLLGKLPIEFKEQMIKSIKEKGYHPSVFDDEMVAYLASNDMPFTKDMAKDIAIPWEGVLELQLELKEWILDKIGDE